MLRKIARIAIRGSLISRRPEIDLIYGTFKESMACSRGIRSAVKFFSHAEAGVSRPVTRHFHATGAKRMGGHGHDGPFYEHAKHMYNLDRMKHQKLKMSLGVLTSFSLGVAIPVYAVVFQQKKTASA